VQYKPNPKEKTMFDTVIDQVQNGKKQFVKTFVTDGKIAATLNEFVDSQTEYTKRAFRATFDATSAVVYETMKHVQDATRFDYNKFGEGIMKAYMIKPTAKSDA
jgi:hypothetical protein